MGGSMDLHDSTYQKGGYAPKEVIPKLIFSPEENAAVQDIMVTLDNYVLEMTSAFLAGNRDIDSFWNIYTAELNNIGLQKMLGTVQVVYDRMYK
jgi:hypothetical protein